MIFETAEVLGAVFPDRVIPLAVVIGIVQVVQFQHAFVGHERHDVADISALRRGIEVIVYSLIGLVRQAFRSLFRRAFGSAGCPAGRQKQGQDQKQR